MVWFNDITELQYYNPINGIPCYCDLLVNPTDLMMQSVVAFAPLSSKVTIEVYSADGLTFLEDATPYFTQTLGVNQNNDTFFQIQLNTFSPAMCANLCWVLKVTVTYALKIVFQKWTDRFCNVACCNTDGVITVTDDNGNMHEYTTQNAPQWSNCNVPIVRIETWNTCYDKFTGDFYGAGFKKVTNIRGRFIRTPRKIEKTISLNCKVQKVKSARTYQLEAWDMYPEWKMDEIELQLQAEFIRIDGEMLLYKGGEPFGKPNICANIYILNAEFQECDMWQVFGCGTCYTKTSTRFFKISSNTSTIYDEDRRVIGTSATDAQVYFRSLNGVVSSEIITPTLECDYEAIIQVVGNGYIPSYIYEGGIEQKYKAFSVSNVNDLCNNLPPSCTPPTIGTITISTITCPMPTIGEITVVDFPILPPAPYPSPGPHSFNVTITEAGTSITDARMGGYEVIGIATDAQFYNNVFFTQATASDTLTSTIDGSGEPRLTFYVGQVVTIIIQTP